MASRCRSFSKPAISIFKSTINKPKSPSSFLGLRPSIGPARPIAQLGSLQSLLPLHSAVASARLTSCLGIDRLNELKVVVSGAWPWLTSMKDQNHIMSPFVFS